MGLELPLRLLGIFVIGSTPQFDLRELWAECAVSFGLGMLGLLAGNLSAPHISEAQFRESIVLLLLYGGVVLATAGTGVVTLKVLVVITCVLIIIKARCLRLGCCG